MTQIDRRRVLALGAASLALPAAIQKAWAIDAKSATGTIAGCEARGDPDAGEPVVRSLFRDDEWRARVRGPVSDSAAGRQDGVEPGAHQGRAAGDGAVSSSTRQQTFAHMRVEGTPHNWADAQYAWDQGRMTNWPDHKKPHAMGHYTQADIPFQWALANAFTLCDAYHCSFQGGTNTNRLFLWTGTNDGAGHARRAFDLQLARHAAGEAAAGEDALYVDDVSGAAGGGGRSAGRSTRTWRTISATIRWSASRRIATASRATGNPALAAKGLATQHLDVLLADVKAGTLPSVSWVISPAKDSEHPGPSSPAQGADYIARVLDALTANPERVGEDGAADQLRRE